MLLNEQIFHQSNIVITDSVKEFWFCRFECSVAWVKRSYTTDVELFFHYIRMGPFEVHWRGGEIRWRGGGIWWRGGAVRWRVGDIRWRVGDRIRWRRGRICNVRSMPIHICGISWQVPKLLTSLIMSCQSISPRARSRDSRFLWAVFPSPPVVNRPQSLAADCCKWLWNRLPELLIAVVGCAVLLIYTSMLLMTPVACVTKAKRVLTKIF